MANRFLIVCGGSGWKLLGQRRVLGVSGELHIDVSGEVKVRNDDPRSMAVRLDEPIGTVQRLLDYMRGQIVQNGAVPGAGSAYLNTSIGAPEDIRHAQFLIDHYPNAGALRDGLAQAPAIGGWAIRHERNVNELKTKIRQMATSLAQNVSETNPIDVWIVSSTAGGTGEGTHRFIAALFAQELAALLVTSLRINFIRVGALTYRGVNPQRTMLNTFFGVAADAAFDLKFKQDFAFGALNWFYVDLPDTGITGAGTQRRADLIELATKAVMLDELAADMNKLLINSQGSRMVVTRTGYWGRDFNQQRKYYETLTDLARKLRALIQPDYEAEFYKDHSDPVYKTTSDLTRVLATAKDAPAIAAKIRAGWKFPKLEGNFKAADPRFATFVQTSCAALNDFLKPLPLEMGALGVSFSTIETIRTGEEERTQEQSLHIPAVPEESNFDAGWINSIRDAHRALAWCERLLEGSDGLKQQLLQSAQKCSAIQHNFSLNKGPEKRAAELAQADGLPGFVELLEKVLHLTKLQTGVKRLLEVQLARTRQLLDLVEKQRLNSKGPSSADNGAVIMAAELQDPLDRLTNESWLCLLLRAAQGGQVEKFKAEVLRGATGLTEQGLGDLLELKSEPDAGSLNAKLRESMGRMYDAEGNPWTAQYWQANTPDSTLAFQYRILPKMDESFQQELLSSQGADTSIRYIFTPLGVIGLSVLAFEGVSLNRLPAPDTLSTPIYLLRPLVPALRAALTHWKENPRRNEPSGQFEVVSAGNIGEPLYIKALRGVGLTDEEITRISEFYPMYED